MSGLVSAKLLTADQLAERFSCSRDLVYELARSGVLPCVRLGRAVRFRIDVVEQWELNGGATGDEAP